MWRRECDTNNNQFTNTSYSLRTDLILDYYSSYHPDISIPCEAYGTLVPLPSKCEYGNIQAYKSRMYHLVRVSQY